MFIKCHLTKLYIYIKLHNYDNYSEVKEMIGQTLAERYRVVERLAGGEFLSTYLAVDMAIGIEVEVDVLAVQMSECTVPAQRLEEILDAAMHVRGSHISPMHGWGEELEDGFFFVVREKIAGASLAEVLSGTGELPQQQVAEITGAAVEVLAEAYGSGLFYLGLNPGQVWLDGRGGVKFFRIGFAWILEEMEPTLAARVSPYRAPETDGGKEGSRTSDVYALAMMVREMLPAGEVSGRLESLLTMAIDPLPRRRPSSPRLLLEELEGGGSGGGRGIPPGEPDGREGSAKNGGPLGPTTSSGSQGSTTSGGGLSFLKRDATSDYISLTQRPRRRILRNLLFVLAGGLVLWLVFAAVSGLLGGKGSEQAQAPPAVEERVTLPDLQGLTAGEAENVLEGLALEHTSREAPSRLWSAGRVVAQEPGEGSVLQPGDMVCLVISTGRDEDASGDAAGGQGSPEATPSAPPSGQAPAPSAETPPSSLQAPLTPQPPPLANTPPRSVPFLSSRSGSAPLYVVMDGSGSCDADGGIVRYVWDCGDGTVLEGVSVQHVFDPAVIPTRFRVVLEVYDAGGLSHSSAVTVEVY